MTLTSFGLYSLGLCRVASGFATCLTGFVNSTSMASPKVKLTYFNLRGRAEPIRLTLLAANVDFEDHRINSNDWPTLKSTVPGGKVPILEVTQGGATKVYTESLAIARLFAKKHHMMGSTDEEYYEIERVIGQCTDIDRELFPAFRASDEEKLKIAQTFRGEAGLRLLT